VIAFHYSDVVLFRLWVLLVTVLVALWTPNVCADCRSTGAVWFNTRRFKLYSVMDLKMLLLLI
jgi:hypothetical protein